MVNDFEYIEVMAKFKENEFSERILKKLFESMGYERVDFNGGILEKGRDLILQKYMPLEDEPYVTIVQAKKIGKKQNTKDSALLTALTHQLYEAIEAGAFSTNGQTIKPRSIMLAFPEQASDRFIAQIKPLLSSFEAKNIRAIIYDGPRVIKDLKKYAPELLDELIPIDIKIYDINDAIISNSELSSAIGNSVRKEISQIYTDLDFFVGSIDSNHLLGSQVKIDDGTISCDVLAWRSYASLYELLKRKFDFNIYKKTAEEIYSDRAERLAVYESELNRENIKNLRERDNDLVVLRKELNELRGRLNKLVEREKNKHHLILEIEQFKFLIEVINNAENYDDEVRQIALEYDVDIAEEVLIAVGRYKMIFDDIQRLNDAIAPYPLFRFEIARHELLNKLDEFKKIYESFLCGSCDKSDLTVLLKGAEASLSFLHALTEESSPIRERISIKINKNLKERIEISPIRILDSGYDVAVYGPAGAGKTTTLSNYAVMKSLKNENCVIYIQLNRVVEKYKVFYKAITDTDESKLSEEDKYILSHDSVVFVCMLLSRGMSVSKNNIVFLRDSITEKNVLILDGLDEAFDSISYLLESINLFKNSHKCQIVISSRDCVKYLKKIDFLGITLLPFTQEQLINFVNSWFNGHVKKDAFIKKIISKSLHEEIHSPLLATIACDLVERGRNIPNNEFEIYEQRFNLLTGDYDKTKKIDRQKFTQKVIARVAMRLAFEMHKLNKREISEHEAIQIFKLYFRSELSNKDLVSLFHELNDPCNILHYDPISNLFSFGHFRFQEYLAAEQILVDRNISITELTQQTWWIGALCLFAQKTDITFIFDDMFNRSDNILESSAVLKQMIKSSPPERRQSLYDLFQLSMESDRYNFDSWGNEQTDFSLDELGINFKRD